MARSFLLLCVALLLPAVALCDYPWPDKVKQYKDYIVVSRLHLQVIVEDRNSQYSFYISGE